MPPNNTPPSKLSPAVYEKRYGPVALLYRGMNKHQMSKALDGDIQKALVDILPQPHRELKDLRGSLTTAGRNLKNLENNT